MASEVVDQIDYALPPHPLQGNTPSVPIACANAGCKSFVFSMGRKRVPPEHQPTELLYAATQGIIIIIIIIIIDIIIIPINTPSVACGKNGWLPYG